MLLFVVLCPVHHAVSGSHSISDYASLVAYWQQEGEREEWMSRATPDHTPPRYSADSVLPRHEYRMATRSPHSPAEGTEDASLGDPHSVRQHLHTHGVEWCRSPHKHTCVTQHPTSACITHTLVCICGVQPLAKLGITRDMLEHWTENCRLVRSAQPQSHSSVLSHSCQHCHTHASTVTLMPALSHSCQHCNIHTSILLQWIAQTVLQPVAKEICAINAKLDAMGHHQCRIGQAALHTLQKLVLTEAQRLPSLALMLPYLEVSSRQDYLCKRLLGVPLHCSRVYPTNFPCCTTTSRFGWRRLSEALQVEWRGGVEWPTVGNRPPNRQPGVVPASRATDQRADHSSSPPPDCDPRLVQLFGCQPGPSATPVREDFLSAALCQDTRQTRY